MAVLAVVEDLVFEAKIQAVAEALGLEVRIARTLADAQAAGADAAVVIIDLNATRLDPLEAVRTLRARHSAVPIIGYGSHVQSERLAQGRVAGCSTVLPRSALVQQLPRLLAPAGGNCGNCG